MIGKLLHITIFRYDLICKSSVQSIKQTNMYYLQHERPCSVSDIQTRAEGESLYIRYNTDANVVNGLKNDSFYEFIGEVILKINVV